MASVCVFLYSPVTESRWGYNFVNTENDDQNNVILSIKKDRNNEA